MANAKARTAGQGRHAVRRQAVRGLTLIELMVVVAVVGVLAAVAAPGMGGFVAARQVEDAARRLAEDMHLARNEAIKRNAPVLLCADASVSDGSCAATPAATDWARGWRVCVDADGNGACDAGSAADPNPIRLQGPTSSAITFTGPLSRLRFNPAGSLTASVVSDFEVRSASRVQTRRWVVRYAVSGALSVRRV